MNMFISQGKISPIKWRKTSIYSTESSSSWSAKKDQLWNRWILSRNQLVFTEYRKIHNKVKSVTVKLTQQEHRQISMECKKKSHKNSAIS